MALVLGADSKGITLGALLEFAPALGLQPMRLMAAGRAFRCVRGCIPKLLFCERIAPDELTVSSSFFLVFSVKAIGPRGLRCWTTERAISENLSVCQEPLTYVIFHFL